MLPLVLLTVCYVCCPLTRVHEFSSVVLFFFSRRRQFFQYTDHVNILQSFSSHPFHPESLASPWICFEVSMEGRIWRDTIHYPKPSWEKRIALFHWNFYTRPVGFVRPSTHLESFVMMISRFSISQFGSELCPLDLFLVKFRKKFLLNFDHLQATCEQIFSQKCNAHRIACALFQGMFIDALGLPYPLKAVCEKVFQRAMKLPGCNGCDPRFSHSIFIIAVSRFSNFPLFRWFRSCTSVIENSGLVLTSLVFPPQEKSRNRRRCRPLLLHAGDRQHHKPQRREGHPGRFGLSVHFFVPQLSNKFPCK